MYLIVVRRWVGLMGFFFLQFQVPFLPLSLINFPFLEARLGLSFMLPLTVSFFSLANFRYR